MNELIKITEKNGKQLVSARDLYEFLCVETPLYKWISRMLDYGFTENLDWTKMSSENQSFNYEYILSIDCAKEISMIQRSEQGKQARQYFIAREKQAKELEKQQLPQDYLSALKALVISEEQKQIAQAELKELQPKAESFDKFIDTKTLQGFKEVANLLGLGRNTLTAKLRYLKIITNKNIPYQQFLNMGLFEVKESTQNGFNRATTYVTAKGINYIEKKLKDKYNGI